MLLPAVGLVQYKRKLLPLVFFLVGMLWITWRAGLVLNDSLDPALEGQDMEVQGWIADLPQLTDRGMRFVFDIQSAQRDGKSIAIPHRIELSVYDRTLQVHAGEQWRLPVRLKRPRGFQNPGGFDHEAHLFQQRIRATGYVRAEPGARRLAAATASPWRYRLHHYRELIGMRIAALLPGDPMAGMVTALANGDQRALDSTQWPILQRTGTIHLVAISGMQVSLVAGVVFFLMRWLWSLPGYTVLRLPAPQAGAVAAVVAGVGYAALAGFSIPTQRALIMLMVILAGTLLQRRVAPSFILAAALLLVLVYDPLSVMAGGFWLSFLAVAAILYVVQGRKTDRGMIGRWRQWTRVQWAVTLGLAPVLLLLFQQASVSAPLANAIAIPVIDLVVVPATLAGVASLGFAPEGVALFLFKTAAVTLGELWRVLEILAKLPHSVWSQHSPLPWTLAAAAVGVLLLLAPRGWPGRWFGGIWLLPLFFVRPPLPAMGEVRFTLLDVGQGLAAVVLTRHHAVVYDTGPGFSSRFDAGRAVVAPYLRQAGVQRMDLLIISHGDNDHLGGAASLREEIAADRVLSSIPERVPGASLCSAPETWEWDGVRFTLIHPTQAGLRHNNSSCVLHIQSAYGSLLLPGDIEREAEAMLVEKVGEGLQSDVLVAPHHGSKTSSTEDFVAHTRPRIVLFPVGYRNRYHHPHPTVLGRYEKVAQEIYDSPRQGAIEIQFGPPGIVVSGYRNHHRRYWFSGG